MEKQPDLFDLPSFWISDPISAFDAFIGSTDFVEMGKHGRARKAEGKEIRPLNKASQEMYGHMFAHFLRWTLAKKIKLNQVSETDIREFLEVREGQTHQQGKRLKSLIRVRYLRLLERVYAHLGAMPNPAGQAAYAVHTSAATGRDKPMAYLTIDEQVAFLRELPAAEGFDPEDYTNPSWKKRRDRAMLAMILGAGLKVSEILSIRIEHVGETDRDRCIPIKVPKPKLKTQDSAHRTILRAFAVPYVLPWLEERRMRATENREQNRRAIPGNLLFPASLGRGEPLNKATVYRHVKSTLEGAGLQLDRMGARTLRNSFAVREIEKGTDINLLKEMMGHYEVRSTEKYIPPEPDGKLS